MYENIWTTVFDAIADGASLKSALRRLNPSPSYAWAKKTLRNDPELQSQYREAQQGRADRLAEQIIDLVDTPMPEGLEGKERSAWVQHLRVQIDGRKWVAAKLPPADLLRAARCQHDRDADQHHGCSGGGRVARADRTCP